MPDLLLGWIRGTLKQLGACWAFIADEEEPSVCNITKKTSMPGCALCCEPALAALRCQEPRSLLRHEAGGFQRALSFLCSASRPVRSSPCISRHATAQHHPRLADPGLHQRQESDSASSAGGALLAPLNSTGKIPGGITGLAGQEQPCRRQPLSSLAFLRPHPGVVPKLSSDVAYFFIHGM